MTHTDDHDMPADRTLPHSRQAEQVTLGAMMLSRRAADEVVELLTSADFYDPRHETVYAMLLAQFGADQPMEPIALAHALDAAGKLGVGAGKVPAEYLQTLTATVPTAANAAYYARIVAEKATMRRLVEAGTRVAQIGYEAASTGHSVEGAVDLAQRTIHDATTARASVEFAPVGSWIGSVVDSLADVVDGKARKGVSTGLGSLDDLIGGFMPGQLIIPAGRPGMGKSVAALGFAKSCVRRGLPAFVFSVEMSHEELMWRLLSDLGEIDISRFTTNRLNRHDLEAIRRAEKVISGWPLHIYDEFRTVSAIRSAARRLTQRYGTPAVIVVDYLQRLTPDRKSDRRDLEVGDFARSLKTLAQELRTSVVAVAQLNRGNESRTDRRPQLSDLRDSGELEQEADIVILLHRDDYYDKECPRAGEADFIVAKHRNGPTDTVALASQLAYCRFADWGVPGAER